MRVFTGQLDATSDIEVQHAHRIRCECDAWDRCDQPATSLEAFRDGLAASPPGRLVERYLGYRGPTPAGFLVLRVPTNDNRHLVYLDLQVLPEHRRHGVGGALLRVAIDRARELDRRLLISTTVQTRPDGGSFASAIGAKPGREGTRFRLTLPTPGQPRLDAMLAEAWTHAEGYRLVRWTGVPPEDLLDDVALLQNRMNTDAPAGDLPLQATLLDGSDIRANVLARRQRGRTGYDCGVLAGDRLVGWAMAVSLIDDDRHADHLATLVAPEHRGHRLGTVLKLEHLRYLREQLPGLTTIDTVNEPSNEYMISINRALGFDPVESLMQWQLEV